MNKIIDNQLYAGGAKIPGSGGGGGGTSSYNDLSNKPKINGVTLSGDKTSSDLHLAEETKTETLTTASKQVKANTIYTGSTLSSVTLTFPTATATYIAKVNFRSGATATTFTVPDTVIMVNDDCSGGVFVPVANKGYSIMFHHNGISFVGIVQGV